jgi:hypothetical protein
MFKKCGLCTSEWGSREEFLSDPDNRFEGYVYLKNRALEGAPVEGLLLFTHRREKCGTTLAIAASRFKREAGSRGVPTDSRELQNGIPEGETRCGDETF